MADKQKGDITVDSYKGIPNLDPKARGGKQALMPDDLGELFGGKSATDGPQENLDPTNPIKVPSAGVGPECSPGEVGEGEKASCLFDGMKLCIADYYDAVQECAEKGADGAPLFTAAMKSGSQRQGGIGNCFGPCAGLEDCKKSVEKRKKECVKRLEKACSCTRGIYNFCVTNCTDDKEPVAPESAQKPLSSTFDTAGFGEPRSKKGPTVSAAALMGSAYGAPVPIVIGRYIVSGNLFWMSDLTPYTITKKSVDTKDPSNPEILTTVTSSFVDVAVAVARGPVTGIMRVWLGDSLIYTSGVGVDSLGQVIAPQQISVYDIGGLTPGGIDYTDFDVSTPTFTFYNGADDQLPHPKMTAKDGVTVTSAHRDLAYVMIENLNLGLMGGQFPPFRFEIFSATEPPIVPRVLFKTSTDSLDFDDFEPDALNLHASTGTLYASVRFDNKDRLRKIDFNSLEELALIDPASESETFESATMFATKTGLVIAQVDNGNGRAPLKIYDANRDIIRSEIGFQTAQTGHSEFDPNFGITGEAFYGSAMSSIISYEASGLAVEAVVIPAAGTDDLAILYYEPTHRRTSVNANIYAGGTELPFDDCVFFCENDCDDGCTQFCIDTEPEFPLQCFTDCYTPCAEECIEQCSQGNLTTQATLPGYFDTEVFVNTPAAGDTTISVRTEGWLVLATSQGSSSAIYVKWLPLHSTQNNRKYFSYMLLTNRPSIAASNYGNETSNVRVLSALPILGEQAYVLIITTDGGDHAIKWRYSDNVVLWSVALPEMPQFSSTNWRRVFAPGFDWCFIDAANNVWSMDLRTGSYTSLFNLSAYNATAYALPLLAGAQLYDPREGSITYITTTPTGRGLIKIFPTRVGFQGVTLDAVISLITSIAGIRFVDTSDLNSIRLLGYGVTEGVAAVSVLQQLVMLYGLRVYDNGNELVFKRPSLTGAIVTVPYNDVSVSQSAPEIKTVKADASRRTLSATLETVDLENFGERLVSTLNVADNNDVAYTDNAHSLSLTVPVALAADDAYRVTEALLTRVNLAAERTETELGPKWMVLEPGDVINIITPENASIFVTIEEVTTSGVYSLISGTRYLPTVAETLPTNGELVSYNGRERVTTTYRVIPDRQTIPVFVAPVIDDHRIQAGVSDDFMIMYTALDAPGEGLDAPVTMYMQQTSSSVLFNPSPNYFPPDLTPIRLSAQQKASYLGFVTQAMTVVTNPGTLDTTTRLRIKFDAQRSVDLIQTNGAALSIDLINDPQRNLLIVGRELVQYKDFVVLGGREVEFFNLLRGRQGTDGIVRHHATLGFDPTGFGERAFLYTADTILPQVVQTSNFINQSQVIVDDLSLGYRGDEYVPALYTSNYDAIRPWAPADISRFDSPTATVFRWKRRHWQTTNELNNPVIPDEADGGFSFIVNVFSFRNNLDRMLTTTRLTRLNLTSPEISFTLSDLSSAFITRTSTTMYVYVTQIRNGTEGFLAEGIFPPGAYPLP